jgi:hypothetical protein
MGEKQLPTFIFTPDNQTLPNEINPNDDEDVKFSFSNFSTHFDEHINKSIRGYSDLRNDVVKISEYFVENDTTVMDLGCSQGSLLRRMKEQNMVKCLQNFINFTSIEIFAFSVGLSWFYEKFLVKIIESKNNPFVNLIKNS